MKTTPLPPHVELAILSREYVLSRSIHAVARLGIADHMSKTPISVPDLAQKTATIPEFLERILNFLSDYGLFNKTEPGYALTDLSGPLREDHPYSIKHILCMVDDSWWQAFAHLDSTLQTGKSGFQLEQNSNFFEYLSNHPEKKVNFQKGLDQLAKYDNQDLLQAYPFDTFKNLVILGGNNQTLEQALMQEYPHLVIRNLDITNRSLTINELPIAEVYLIKGILHDLSEEKISQVLSACYHHMPENALLLIAEQIKPNDDLPHTNKTMDIIMMMLVGGKQRSLENWQTLIESFHFKLDKVYPTRGVYSLMEFRK